MAMQVPAISSDGSMPQPVRRAISRMVLDLRSALEEDYRRQLAALGVSENGVHALAADRQVAPMDRRAREIALATIERETKTGTTLPEAFASYLRESAFTFLNRMLGLRCLEEHGLLLVDGQPERAITLDPARNATPLYWRVRNALPPNTSPREVWRETLARACSAISQQVRVLFDPDSEYAALFPLQTTLQCLIDAFNSPDIPAEAYAQDEFLGWVYQYYNSKDKDAVFAKLAMGGKIDRPSELSAATCLYTERYMVDYLLQNTLGTLWVEMHPDSKLPERWPYYVRPPEGNPKVERPIKPLREITVLDPACGSGHFLVRAFNLLVDMYREEGLEPESEIPNLILERNLHGIDIDLRAVQIAALALYIKGCLTAGPQFRPRRINLVPADAILPDSPPKEYMARFEGDKELADIVTAIWQGLKNVREFGSLLHPERAVDEVVRRRRERERGQFWERGDEEWQHWKTDLLEGLRKEFERQAQSEDIGQRLFGEEAAKGVSLVEALGGRYNVVVTNPPYAGSKNLSPGLKAFVEREYKEGKRDLYAAFIQRCRDFASLGYVGMVTQQSWMFLRSFAALRKDVLDRTTLATLAHLGPRAFEEISGEVVNIALFTLRNTPGDPEHRLVAFRLIGPKSPGEKDGLLRGALVGAATRVVSSPRQADFLPIPETPFVYWLRPRFLELLSFRPKMGDKYRITWGVSSSDNDRFLRLFWETDGSRGYWLKHAKGGGFRRWRGMESWALDWRDDGRALKQWILERYPYLKTNYEIKVRPDTFFKHGWAYSSMARQGLSFRYLDNTWTTNAKSPSVFTEGANAGLGVLLNSRLMTFLVRATSTSLNIDEGYVGRLPYDACLAQSCISLGESALQCAAGEVTLDPLERSFHKLPCEKSPTRELIWTLGAAAAYARAESETINCLRHSLEGISESSVFRGYRVADEDAAAVLNETGVPAGWNPLITGYDAIPMAPEGIRVFVDMCASLVGHERRTLGREEFSRLKAHLRRLYQVGSGDAAELPGENGETSADEGEEEAALGTGILIPTETFLEDLSQRLEIHPISVYWLLKELREQEGLVCPPELKRHLEDYVSVSLLRMLGFRWPEQDAYEKEHRPILDPALVDEDGIIPLVACAQQQSADERIRARLERDFGEQGAAHSEHEFKQWVGKSIGEWLRKDFFRRHVQQFKQRPIAWHLVSPERNFEAFVLYHKLSQATLQKLRGQYAGGLIARLKADQQRARERKEDARARELQAQIEDVEEFRTRIEAIELGTELKHRIRCRWKDEEAVGRPGPYAPDIDDGVKVNIRPFQEAGLLAVKEVIKKW